MALAVAGLLALPAPAFAREATREEVRTLAQRAGADPDALRSLLDVDSVDGVPVDLASALRGASADERSSLLRVLATDAATDRADAPDARQAAARILREPRFREADLPRPFRGILERAGAVLQAVADAIAALPAIVATVVGVLVVALAAVSAALLGRRRTRAVSREVRVRRRAARRDPSELERRAADAAREGRFAEAVRLRFLAGLWRLDDAEAIRYRESMRSAEVARVLRMRSFDEVARTFDEIVYGNRDAEAGDDVATRTGWQKVLEEVSSSWQRRA